MRGGGVAIDIGARLRRLRRDGRPGSPCRPEPRRPRGRRRRGGAFPCLRPSLAEAASGLVPASEGWFVVNAAEAAWVGNPDFGWRCSFEANGPALRESPDLEQRSLRPARLPPPRSRAGEAERPLSRRVGAGGLPRSRRRVPHRRRGGGTAPSRLGLRPLSARHAPRLRRDRQAVRDPHDRARERTRARSSTRSLRRPLDTARPRGRDVLAARGVCTPSPLAAGASRV